MPTALSRARPRAERAALDAALLEAVAQADEAGVKSALVRGADVNTADDATGLTAITCAIAGDSNWEDVDVSDASFLLPSRVQVLRMLLSSESTSLYALNAPTRGVTPLGLAAWLNIPDAVRVLLEESRGLVAVDGTDSLGVTPLMYAARDGAAEAASILLANGARPDLRDTHHRTAIHYSLHHSRLLCLCESMLRKQRLREYFSSNRRQLHTLPHPNAAFAQSFTASSFDPLHWPTPSETILSRSTAPLIRAIVANDVPAIYQILFPASHRTTILVNRLDSLGWAPIHHCVSVPNPSVEILDALFLAGADTSLYTSSKHGTPLHCLALRVQNPSGPGPAARLHVFVHHLIRELRAPLSAIDEEGETCIHVAAEHGKSVELLLAFLACDTRGTVREMKNSRGLTALEVSKPEFRAAFGAEAEPRRSNSVASFRTIRPSTSSSMSFVSYASSMTTPSPPQLSSIARLESLSDSVDSSLLPHRILENLATVGQEISSADELTICDMRELLDETSHFGELWIHSVHARIQEAAQDLRDARGKFNDVDSLLETITRELEGVFGKDLSDHRDSSLDRTGRRTRDSGDSDSTAVSDHAPSTLSRKWRSMSDLRPSTESAVRELPEVPELPYFTIAEEGAPAPSVGDKSTLFLNALLSPTAQDFLPKSGLLSAENGRTASPAPSKKDSSSKGTAKLKAWLKKKLRFEIPDSSNEVKIVLPGEQSPRAPRSPAVGQHSASTSNVVTFSMARHLLRTAGRDLSCIEGCMDEADEFLSLAANLLSQTDRRLKMLIVNRQAALESSRVAQLQDQLDDPFMSAIASTIRSATHDPAVPFPTSHTRSGSDSDNSLQSVSAGSSVVSLSSTLIESEDDDTRVLRRLLTRKVEARIDGAFDEIDKALTWLRIVQDTLRSLRRRTQPSMAMS